MRPVIARGAKGDRARCRHALKKAKADLEGVEKNL